MTDHGSSCSFTSVSPDKHRLNHVTCARCAITFNPSFYEENAVLVRAFDAGKIQPPADFENFHWPESFCSANRLDLEIGCGVGWHPIRYALDHPDRHLIAIEHTREKFSRFRERVRTHGHPDNLLPIHADAVRWITHAIKPESVDCIFILYPNPEPKSASQRWFRMPFMAKLREVLKPGGTILLATNSKLYFEEAVLYAEKAWGFGLLSQRHLLNASDPKPRPRTHFEKKYLERGETCFEAVFEKSKPEVCLK